MNGFYPGDATLFLVVRIVVAAGIVCLAGLLASCAFARNFSARYTILSSAILCSLILPGIAVVCWSADVAFLSLPWLPAETDSSGDSASKVERKSVPILPASSRVSFQPSKEFQNQTFGRRPPTNIEGIPHNPPTIPRPQADTPPVPRAESRNLGQDVATYSFYLWVFGTMALLFRVIWSSFRLVRFAPTAITLPNDQRQSLAKILDGFANAGNAPVVVLSERVPGPMACGIIRPRILLPPSLLGTLSRDQLRDVLTHELAHLLRRDPLMLLLQRIAGSLYWPLPFVHFLNRELNHLREELCDNHVLVDRDPVLYGETLLRVAELVCQTRPRWAASGMLSQSGKLERRIIQLLDERRNIMTKQPKRYSLLAFGILLVAGATLASVRITKASSQPSEHESQSVKGVEEPRHSPPQFALVEPNEQNTDADPAAPKTHRMVFKPLHGMDNQSTWTVLTASARDAEKTREQMIARLTLQGEIPVQRSGDKEPIFKIRLMAGSDNSLNIRLTTSDNTKYDRILHRDKPLAWKVRGQTYQITYASTEVTADQPPQSNHAFVFVTCEAEAAEKKNGNEKQTTLPPEESQDDSQGDGGSDLLRNIRAATEPILKDMAEKASYGLRDGQHVRLVPLPFSELRSLYYRVGHPHQSEAIPKPPTHMLFHWNNGQLRNWGLSFGGPPKSGQSVKSILTSVTDFESQEIDGAVELLEMRVAGDWVVRVGEPVEKILPQLEAILRKELSVPIHLEIKKVERPVYVVAGEYKLTPLEGEKGQGKLHLTDKTITTDNVHIFGKSFVPNSGAGGGTGDFQEFLKSLGYWVHIPIVNEVNELPMREISWRYHERSPFTDEMQRQDHDAETVLANIAKQTNLKFTKTTRPVRILFVSRGN